MKINSATRSVLPASLAFPSSFRVLFYNSRIPARRVKENLNRQGMQDLVFISDESDLINSVKGLDPQVIVLNHREWNDLQTPLLLKRLRKFSDIPVIIWNDGLNETVSQKLLSFKNTYTLRLGDGFECLTEVLERIEMKLKYPNLWV